MLKGIAYTVKSFRAVLAGTKTQTRRIVKDHAWATEARELESGAWELSADTHACSFPRPRYQRGNLLYWNNEPVEVGTVLSGNDGRTWRASLRPLWAGYPAPWRNVVIPDGVKRPQLGRYRGRVLPWEWAHPWRGLVIDVRCEPLQEISNADCLAEGVSVEVSLNDYGTGSVLRDAYAAEWDQINAKRGHPWAANDWVWVYEITTPEGAKEPADA